MKNDDYNTNTYWYKRLLREIKELDTTLTYHLVNDKYHNLDYDEESVIKDIKIINDMTNFILNKIKKKKIENGEEYNNYYLGDTEKHYEAVKDIHNAWESLDYLKDEIDKEQYKHILTRKNKGYDFGWGYSNFCSLEIQGKDVENNCTTTYQILGITTIQGKHFGVYASEEYIKRVYKDLTDDVQISNKKISLRKDFSTKEEAIEYVKELIKLFDDNYDKEQE